jgi:hypothetical protein
VLYFLVDRNRGLNLPSTPEDIAAVYNDDILKQSYIVETKFGKRAFYDDFVDMSIRRNIDYDPTKVAEKNK